MRALEILEAHTVKRPWSEASRMKCRCGEVVTAETESQLYALHRAHVAQVLDQHMREREAEALEEAADAVFDASFGQELPEAPIDLATAAVSAYLAHAQPSAVTSVEVIPAQVQIISWEEKPEHECWKLAPDETFVGLIVKSDRSWSPADKYTLNIERPEVKP